MPEPLQLPARRGSVTQARRWVRVQARTLGLPDEARAVLELLTSELVANAVLHGSDDDTETDTDTDDGSGPGPAITVTLVVEHGRCTLSVRDRSDDRPVLRSDGPEVPGGQGLRLVERLADDWGSHPRPGGGKTVWFDVPVDDAAACPST